MIPTLYRGSVKDLLGPVATRHGSALIFDYSDAYSVFDWGRMPDSLPGKGQALAILAAHWLTRLSLPEAWREFSKSPEAMALRKGNRFGVDFIEVGERLQREGLRTHFQGALKNEVIQGASSFEPQPLESVEAPFNRILVSPVSAVKPAAASILGRSVPDYQMTRNSPLPRLIPLEVVFRFSTPPGSSLLERVERDPCYLAVRGFPDVQLGAGKTFDFPVLELFTKLEASDRPVDLTEALAISGISAPQLQELLFKTAWVASWLKSACSKAGLELADGKLEWALGENGECFLVDAIGPDELRILKDGMQLSKEFLRDFYRTTPWYESVTHAKKSADAQGLADWKRLVSQPPPPLTPAVRELGSHLYRALTQLLTGRVWFNNVWSFEKVLEGLKALQEGRS